MNYNSDGKMPTSTELDEKANGLLQLIAQATAGIEESREDMRADDARIVERIAAGLESEDDLTLYQFLMYDIGRGITTYNAYGAFTHSEKKVLETVVSKYEINRVIEDARKIDPQVFVTVAPIKKVYGNFKKKTIA